ncbi:MAG: peptidase dimerization domain-containing protein [Kiritimatiellae bacterium]|nr:peptidase dimerization domain-containing protein [Kiritimatiellia bacterium]
MEKALNKIGRSLPQIRDVAESMRDEILANLVLLGEMPAPSGGEEARIKLLLDRFAENDMIRSYSDDAGNGVAVVEGDKGRSNILLVAHADTSFPAREDHTVQLSSESACGFGLGDNSMGLAALATLPALLRRLNISLKSNLILLAATKSQGAHDLEGLRFFLNNNQLPLLGAVCVDGMPQGKLSTHSTGLLRAEVICRVPREYDWTRFGATGAIMAMNEIINKISTIELPTRPRTSIVYATIHGGTSFSTVPRKTSLSFNVLSESEETIQRVERRITDIVEEVGIHTRGQMSFNILCRRKPAELEFSHPLARCARYIFDKLDIEPLIRPSGSELSAVLEAGIPAVTIGITEGDQTDGQQDNLLIAPIGRGMAQLVGLILALDGGLCRA